MDVYPQGVGGKKANIVFDDQALTTLADALADIEDKVKSQAVLFAFDRTEKVVTERHIEDAMAFWNRIWQWSAPDHGIAVPGQRCPPRAPPRLLLGRAAALKGTPP